MNNPYPSTALDAARRAIADQLREIRRDAGLTGRDVAARTGWQPSKVSRLQSATTPPSDDDIREWCTACGAEGRIPDLLAANRTADSMYMEWRRVQRTGLRRLQESRIPLYERTRQFRVYSSTVIPGFLQTHGYAAALLGSIARFHGTPDDVDDAATARVERSKIVQQAGRTYSFVVEEAALRRAVGGPDVMTEQLLHLLDAARYPAVSLGVIPSHAHAMWPLETFSVYDDETVFVELLTASLTITAPTEVAQYVTAHAEMTRAAVFGPDAYRIIAGSIPPPS
ncbi:helix-turn-helix domain-containing protein [Streptomyces sp. NPDC056891]|uniref:helix-turn-helix domain-containing protein n=1 Tax=Streptomyces sp. NPDC056891 TaxID=3345961 RepID=UPI0036CF3DE7